MGGSVVMMMRVARMMDQKHESRFLVMVVSIGRRMTRHCSGFGSGTGHPVIQLPWKK